MGNVQVALQWLAVELLTGHIICDLPSITSEDPFLRTIGQYETSNVGLTIPADGSIDPEWQRGVLEGASALIGYTGDPGSEIVQWGGVVTGSNRNLSNQVPIRLVTPDGLLDRRYTGNYTTDPTGVGATLPQNTIVSDVVTQFAADSGGFPITVVQLPDPPGVVGNTARAVTYYDYEDKTVYSTLQALMGLDGGPEWTVHWYWDHTVTPNTITPYLYVGTRIGNPVSAGLGPAVTFDESMCVSAELNRDYGQGKGANVLTAVSPGQGLGRLQATVAASDPQRPKYELRWTPNTNTFDDATLTSYATAAGAAISGGSQSLTLTVRYDVEGSRFGTDWGIGDDIGYSIQSPGIPDRIEGTARCIGYQSTDTTVTPILAQPGDIA